MNQFLQNFLRGVSPDLAEIRQNLQILREKPDDTAERQILRRVFQIIHTIKGAAAAFELENSSAFAHELETLLDKLRFGEICCDDKTLDALENGFGELEILILAESGDKNDDFSTKSLDALRTIKNADRKSQKIVKKSVLPAEVFEKLNQIEQKHLRQICENGAGVYLCRVSFQPLNFQTKLTAVREALEKHGEIITTLPAGLTANNEIALQIVFGADITAGNCAELIKKFDGKIVYPITSANKTDLQTIAATAILAGRKIAESSGKIVEFTIKSDNILFSDEQITALSQCLLHLIRNAVTHGIETVAERQKVGKNPQGSITIRAEKLKNSILIRISDDGRGIDLEKIAEKAHKISGNKIKAADLTWEKVNQLIFSEGFSTAAELNENAGRGVGLDAVLTSIKAVNGKINLFAKQKVGTTFEIELALIEST